MADLYAREAARVAALHLADAAGFDVVQQSCVEILSDLLLRYVHEVGAGSHTYAELAGRSETNPVDVALALNDMCTSVSNLREFLQRAPEMPFEANISAFPLRKKSRPQPTFAERGEVPPPHIPAWLPALPDRHTYSATPVYAGHEQDPQKRQEQLTKQRQQAETAAVRLQARLAADSNLLLAAKLEQEEEQQAAAAGGMQEQQHAAAAAPTAAASAAGAAAASNPFLALWGDVPVEQPEPRVEAAPLGAAAAEPGGQGKGEPACAMASEPASTVEWAEAAWTAGGGAPAGGSGFVAQQLFATHDWKAQQQRRARIATSGRAVREAFGEAYGEQAAARLGKRQKRSGGGVSAAVAAAAAANDPTRNRVENILESYAQNTTAYAAGTGREDVVQEQI